MQEGSSIPFLKMNLAYHPPILTVAQPKIIDPPWAVESPIRAAGFPPIFTVADPMIILSGGPAQTHWSPTHAAGKPPIRTVAQPGGNTGPPTCGTGPLNIGQTCISETRAAKGIIKAFNLYLQLLP